MSLSSPTARVRFFGVVGFLVGLAQMIVASLANALMDGFRYGMPWAGAAAVVIFCITSPLASGKVGMGISFSISLVAAIGIAVCGILDLLGYIITERMKTCINDSGETYGNSDYYFISGLCQMQNPDYSCVCVIDNSGDCYGYDLQSGNDCDVVLDELPGLLLPSFVLSFAICLLMTMLSFTALGSICCPSCCDKPDGANVFEGATHRSSL